MPEKFSPYDPADALSSPEAIEVFMSDAFETGDAAHIAAALGIVVRAPALDTLAKRIGLSHEELSKSLGVSGKPSLQTTLAVMKALGMDLAVSMDGTVERLADSSAQK